MASVRLKSGMNEELGAELLYSVLASASNCQEFIEGNKVSRLTILGVSRLLSGGISEYRGSLGLSPPSSLFPFSSSPCLAIVIVCVVEETLETDWGDLTPIRSMEDLFCLGVLISAASASVFLSFRLTLCYSRWTERRDWWAKRWFSFYAVSLPVHEIC